MDSSGIRYTDPLGLVSNEQTKLLPPATGTQNQ